MKDDRKWEISQCMQAIRNWYAEDGYYQRMDYHRTPLSPKELEYRKGLIQTAIESAEKIKELLLEELERVDGS